MTSCQTFANSVLRAIFASMTGENYIAGSVLRAVFASMTGENLIAGSVLPAIFASTNNSKGDALIVHLPCYAHMANAKRFAGNAEDHLTVNAGY